jgi:putative protease
METKIGRVTHFYNRISVAVLSLTERLEIGDKILIEGHSTELVQEVTSMEIEHQKVTSVGPGDEVALKVDEPVKEGDIIYKMSKGTP